MRCYSIYTAIHPTNQPPIHSCAIWNGVAFEMFCLIPSIPYSCWDRSKIVYIQWGQMKAKRNTKKNTPHYRRQQRPHFEMCTLKWRSNDAAPPGPRQHFTISNDVHKIHDPCDTGIYFQYKTNSNLYRVHSHFFPSSF